MSYRSSDPRRDKKNQHAYHRSQYSVPDAHRGKEGTYFPPIGADTASNMSYSSLTGHRALGMRSSPGKPMKAHPSDDRDSDSGRNKSHGRASPNKDRGKPHYPHGAQKHRSSTPKLSRSRESRLGESFDHTTPHTGHKRSSSLPKGQVSSNGPSLYSGTSSESRHQSSGVWNGSGADLIAHRASYDASKYGSTTRYTTGGVRESNVLNGLAQSALKTFHHSNTSTKGPTVSTSTGSGDGRTQPRSYNTARSPPLADNANNNSSTIGSTSTALSLSTPRSSSNGGKPLSDTYSPPLPRLLPATPVSERLSGGGTCYSTLKSKTGEIGTRYEPDPAYVSASTGVNPTPSRTQFTVTMPPSPPPTGGAVSGRGGLRGLRNLGNTCFMNSILQCLSHTPGLAELFLDKKRLKYCSKSMLKGELAKAYADLVGEMWREGGSVAVSPHAFKSQIQKYARRFMGYEQQDCQEFLRFMLAGLHDELNQPKERPRSTKSFASEQAEADYCWKKYLSYEHSDISDLFMGQLKSTLVCLECSHKSLTFDPFWDLSLPMHRSKSTSYEVLPLQSCLREFTAKEKLTGSEQAYCDKCDALRDSEKRFELQVLPKILVLHLKRFSGLRFRSKLDTAVEVPKELDLSPYRVKSSEPSKYCLYAMSNHSGTAYGGHYTALSRHVCADKWFLFNDSQVSQVSPPPLSTSQAYVLFYFKKE